MESVRRWWSRYGMQLLAACVGLGAAWWLRETQGAVLMEMYQVLARPFQREYSAAEVLRDRRVAELQFRLTELENQNRRYKALLGSELELNGGGLWAAAIGRSADAWWQHLLVGRGSLDGIDRGAIAVGPGGLVGRVVSVSPHTSRILLISDPSSQVGVSISRTRQAGILRGRSQDEAELEFFVRDPDVKPGDLVLTSSYSTLFPPGLPVGVVRSLDLERQPAPVATVTFSAPLGILEFVQLYPYRPAN